MTSMSCHFGDRSHDKAREQHPPDASGPPTNGWKTFSVFLAILFLLVNGRAIAGAGSRLLGAREDAAAARSEARPADDGAADAAVAEAEAARVDESAVLPPDGIEIPVVWDDLGALLITSGAIDPQKLESLYAGRGGISDDQRRLLYEKGNGTLRMDMKNAGFLLNMLWALGLGQKDPILEEGPMRDPRFGGAERFASTGGWSLAKGDAMEHYGKHRYFTLTTDQQALVERVSNAVYRPCCDNPTSFPDCNHGMAMLGLFELMASQGATEDQLYRTALQVNAYWFPSQYLTIAKSFKLRGIEWKDIDPREALSAAYSSSTGYGAVAQEIGSVQFGGGQGCGA